MSKNIHIKKIWNLQMKKHASESLINEYNISILMYMISVSGLVSVGAGVFFVP